MTSGISLLFAIGAGLGVLVALAGGIVDYRLHLRRREGNDAPRVPLLLIIGGFLGLAGVVAMAVSIFVAESIRPALAMGIGVGIGFNGGFLGLLLIWLVRERLRRSARKSEEPRAPQAEA